MSWDTKPLGDICSMINGRAFKPTEWSTVGLPIIRIQNLNDENKEFNYYNGSFDNKHKVVNGDLLFSWSGTPGTSFGAFFWNRGDAVLNQHIFNIRFDKESLFNRYFLYALNSQLDRIISQSHGGVGLKHITKGKLEAIKIPLPPLETQKRIVALLDKAQELIDKRKEQITLMDQLIQSLFYDMFGDPVTNPKGWEYSPTIKYCSSIVPGRDKPKSFTGDTPWVTTDDLNHLGMTYGSKKGLGLSEAEIKQVKAKVIPEFSVIMTCVGDLGVVTVNGCKMVVNQQLHAFQCYESIFHPIFLMHSISHQTPYMYKMASSTTVPYMNKKVANNTPTIVPPLEVQLNFVKHVNNIEAQKETMTSSLKELENNFNSLMQRAFKGEL